MDSRGIRIFLTFVLSGACLVRPALSRGATTTPSPDFDEPTTREEAADPQADEARRATIDITEPPPPRPRSPEERTEFFYPYRRAITARFGPTYATKAVDGQNNFTLIGALYTFPSQKLKSLEAGADLVSDGSGALHFAKRIEYSRSRFRPYVKYGGGVRVIPKEQLVSFIKIGNYQARGAVGFEQLVLLPQSLRLEFEATVSTEGAQAILTLGYLWGW